MIIAGTVAALLALWLIGALTLRLLGLRDTTSPTRLAADLVTGAVVLALLGTTIIVVGGQVHVLAVYGVLAVLAALAIGRAAAVADGRGGLARGWRRRLPRIGSALPRTRVGVASLIVAGLVLLLVASASLHDRLAWDGWAFWAFKAKALHLDGTLVAPLLDATGPYAWTHPEYPLALPLLQWWLFRHAGDALPALASFHGAVWLALLPLLLWQALRDRAGEAWAGGAALGAVAFWPWAHYAIGGYAEILMIVACLGAAIELERGLGPGGPGPDGRGPDGPGPDGRGSTGRFALFLALAALAKNEGLALATIGVVVAAGSLMVRGERQPARYGWLLLPLLAAAPWFAFTRGLGLGAEHLGTPPGIGDMVGRIPVLLAALVDLATHRSWVALPPLLLAPLVARAVHGVRTRAHDHRPGRSVDPARAPGAAWLLLLGYFGVVMAVYLTTSLELEWLLDTTLDRVVSVIVPAAVYLAIVDVAGVGSRLETRFRRE